MFSFRQARYFFPVVFAALCLLPTSVSIYAQDYSSIRKANEDSVVFIHSVRTRKDGTGSPEHHWGTGFIVSDGGYVATANHVVTKDDDNTLVATTGAIRSRYSTAYKLEPVKRDPEVDVMLLVFPDVGVKWKPVTRGNSKAVPTDAPLFALGFPGSSDLSSAPGILSSKFGPKGVWQTTMPINRGNSGGPVFDATGKVVAIASAGNDAMQGVTFAIPESYASGLIQIASLNVLANTINYAWTGSTPNAVRAAGGDWLDMSYVYGQTTTDARISEVLGKFVFYRTVDHDAKSTVAEKHCLPSSYRVRTIRYGVAAQNGQETKLGSVEIDPDNENCVTVKAVISGVGVTKVGPITIEQMGRGWLGVDVRVEGIKVLK